MILYPNAKINIGLSIISKRDDGFHNIETILLPIPLEDCLEIELQEPGKDHEITFSGIAVDCDPESNLIMKAIRILERKHKFPKLKIHLLKLIPFGAGLGGGSADAAFTLKGINNMFDLKISDDELCCYGSELGCDTPIFIKNRAAIGEERGDILSSIEMPDLSNFKILLVKPNVAVNTAAAYRGVKPNSEVTPLRELIKLPIEMWQKSIKNQFEDSVFPQYPEVAKLKETIMGLGSIYCSMSGSGSSVFGIFRKEDKIDTTTLPSTYFIKEIKL